MNLAELVSEVYIQTNRPDLVEQTSSAIRAATLALHHSDFYSKDIFETAIKFDSPSFVNQVDTSIFPNYRKLKWLRKLDATTNTPGAFLTPLTPENVLDSYSVQKCDIVYEAGQNFNINSSTEDQYYLVGVYTSPNVTSLNYNSWIADNYSFLIIYKAAAQILTDIGNLELARLKRALAEEQMSIFQAASIALVGE